MSSKKIVFFGALPPKDESKVGGGEWGNLRTVKMLRQFGYDVQTIRKTSVKSNRSYLCKILTSPFRTLWDVIKVAVVLTCNRGVVFHYSGFAWKTIHIEYIIIRVAKLIGCRLVYEIRGGGLLASYADGDKRYVKKLNYILNHSEYVFSQGCENIPLIKTLSVVPVYHYANCVSEDFYPSCKPSKPQGIINLVYFGRISTDKNVSLIIETTRILQQSGKKISLTLVGNGHDQNYVNRIQKEMSSLEVGTYVFMPGCTHDKLRDILKDKHFYLFPSQVVLEGQSNSVTEAMSFGIIPIASPQGFNRSTIGEDKLIVENLIAADYAKIINEIVDNNRQEYYSQFVYDRFVNNYTEKVVFEKTRLIYNEIFENN